MILRILWIILTFAVIVRGCWKIDNVFKELKWYDKICRCYWIACMTVCSLGLIDLLLFFIELLRL
jgi:hypothetical protein